MKSHTTDPINLIFNDLLEAIGTENISLIKSILSEADEKKITSTVLKETDEKGRTLLHIASMIEDNHDVINLLCQKAKYAGIIKYASFRDKSGSTAGHYAIEIESLSNFEALIYHELNINLKRVFGKSEEDIITLINKKYGNNEILYILFMKLIVKSKAGKIYFLNRHSDIDPNTLSEVTLTKTLKIDRISDHSNDSKLHLESLKYCFTVFESTLATHNEIQLALSHLYVADNDNSNTFKALNLILIYDQHPTLNLEKGLINTIFSAISIPEKFRLPKIRQEFIKSSFFSNWIKFSENEYIKTALTRVAFSFYRCIENSDIAFHGLQELEIKRLTQDNGMSKNLFTYMYGTTLTEHFIKMKLKRCQCDLKYYVEKLTLLLDDDTNELTDLLERNIERALIPIQILESTLKKLAYLKNFDEVLDIINHIDLIYNCEHEIIKNINTMIETGYIKKISSIDLDSSILERIKTKACLPFTGKNIKNKIEFTELTKLKEELIEILKIAGLTQESFKNTPDRKALMDKKNHKKEPIEIIKAYKLLNESEKLFNIANKNMTDAANFLKHSQFTAASKASENANMFFNQSSKLSFEALCLLNLSKKLGRNERIVLKSLTK
jgi:hypothetical protein